MIERIRERQSWKGFGGCRTRREDGFGEDPRAVSVGGTSKPASGVDAVQEQGAKPYREASREAEIMPTRMKACLCCARRLGRAASSRLLRGFWSGFRFTSVDESLREALHALGCCCCSSAFRGSQFLPIYVDNTPFPKPIPVRGPSLLNPGDSGTCSLFLANGHCISHTTNASRASRAKSRPGTDMRRVRVG
ncbi:hypothetical protein N431DRAFT_87785 [Stipitochalara longipes BDJ]|nr:hypothetical protein N431DRAFT_87785 [Stipitochalara longipes BDJ]